MKLKDYTKEDFESMSYSELTALILNDKGSKMKIVDIFKKICELLGLSDRDFENKIADFFELITTDKNFIVLEKGFCDLKTKHNKKVVIEDEDEDEVVDSEEIDDDDIEEETGEEEEDEEDIFYDDDSSDDDIEDDDLDDFVVVEDDETSM